MTRGRCLGLAALLLGSCTQAVRYTDALTDARTGRTLFVRVPASFGGVVGFVVGVPFDILALPVSYPVYVTRPEGEPRDALSIFLFPSFVLWRAGVLLAMPFDALEYTVWRGWTAPAELTPENRERLERTLDSRQWDSYPVEPIYPLPPARGETAAAAGGSAP
jgi:hypothetical protein